MSRTAAGERPDLPSLRPPPGSVGGPRRVPPPADRRQAALADKYRDDFLRDVLTGRAGDDARILEFCGGFGWDLARPVTVLVAEPDECYARAADPSAQVRLAAEWRTVVLRHDGKAAVAGFAHEVVAVVAADVAREPSSLVAEVADRLTSGPARGPAVWTFTTGTGRPADGPATLPESYRQALTAVRIGRRLHGPGALAGFDQLGVYRLLSLVSDPAELHAFVTETLGELARDDEPDTADLRRTLRVLLETNLNVAETARRLHFHYNTLRYRIGKLERMLGPFTEDAHLRLSLTLALHVQMMRGGG